MWIIQGDRQADLAALTGIQLKTMVTIFMNGHGLQIIDVKLQRVKIYAGYFLYNIIQKIENLEITKASKHQKQKMLLIYDNLPSHNANMVTNFLKKTTLRKVPHPPYSPDLAICNFGIFGTAKTSFQGKLIGTENELLSELQKFLCEKQKELYISLFENRTKHLQRCIDIGGEYIEKSTK